MNTFRIGDLVGSGGMATVHLAVQEGPGGFEKFVAFKRVMAWVSSSEHLADAFLKEARLAAALTHPNIVGTLDVGRDGVSPYIIMEYLRGESIAYLLKALRAAQIRFPVPVACHIAAQVAAGLHHAHSQVAPDGSPAPIVHRDVSPSNIMVCYNGAVKLLDFGIATRPAEGLTESDALKGKLSHMAPEQLKGATADPRSDVFQLGVVLWEMLTMRRLFNGGDNLQRMHAVLNGPIAAPSEHNELVPAELDAVVLSALERDPERRCPSALALQEQLETCINADPAGMGGRRLGQWLAAACPDREEYWARLEQEALSAPSVSAEPGPARRVALPPWVLGGGLGVAAAVTVLGVGWLLLFRGPAPQATVGLEPRAPLRGASTELVSGAGATTAPAAAPAPPVFAIPRPEPRQDRAPPEPEVEAEPEPEPEPEGQPAPAAEAASETSVVVVQPSPDEPVEGPDEGAATEWRVADEDEILDPFAPRK